MAIGITVDIIITLINMYQPFENLSHWQDGYRVTRGSVGISEFSSGSPLLANDFEGEISLFSSPSYALAIGYYTPLLFCTKRWKYIVAN